MHWNTGIFFCVHNMSQAMRKPFVPYANNSRKSACTSTQSDQHLHYSLLRYYNICSFYKQILKPLAVSVAEQASLSLTWSEIPKTGFLMTWLLYYQNDPKLSSRQVWANSVDPDQKKQTDQGLHCLPFHLHLSDPLLYDTILR